jgi:xanthine dehydrogenase accessory factor
MQLLDTWIFIQQALQLQREVVLMCVIESTGSSPGRQGFIMAVDNHKNMHGTIGGGIMENKLVDLVHQSFAKKKNGLPKIIKQIHDKKARKNQSGMICSGEQYIAFYSFKAEDQKVLQQIIHCLTHHQNAKLTLTESKIQCTRQISRHDYQVKINDDQSFKYIEKLGYKNELHIIGAGHCSLALSKLFSDMDFQIHVYDNRASLNTFSQNNYAHHKQIVNDYSGLAELIPQGKNIYVVIMTIGYRSDAEVLSRLIHRNYAYIGMLGSKAKIKKLFHDFEANNIPYERMSKVHAPIGINIKSESSSEIAISIAAEIISLKNKDKK